MIPDPLNGVHQRKLAQESGGNAVSYLLDIQHRVCETEPAHREPNSTENTYTTVRHHDARALMSPAHLSVLVIIHSALASQ